MPGSNGTCALVSARTRARNLDCPKSRAGRRPLPAVATPDGRPAGGRPACPAPVRRASPGPGLARHSCASALRRSTPPPMPDPLDSSEAIRRFLGQWSPMTRAEGLHLALQSLRDRVEPDRVLACELAWEVHAQSYWSQVRNADGTRYTTEEASFPDFLGLASWRTAYKRLAVGRMLMTFQEPPPPLLRSSIARVGLAKATVV